MREAIQFIRQKIYTALNGNIPNINNSVVNVYNRVPRNAEPPYVWVYSGSTNEVDQNAQNYCLECITRIECITRFDSDIGGDLDCNTLVSEVLTLLRTRASGYFDLSSNNFNVYINVSDGVTYEQIDKKDHTYVIGVIELATRVEQLN
tara:strand:- start:2599 stop:3042 length:444 start_codon:yes stop_codon:yes gene_type:complete